MNMNSRWVYLCVVCRWYVYVHIHVHVHSYMRICACLWEPMGGYGYGT